MKPLPRLGLVGLGDAGRHHARALDALQAEGLCQWTALCARDAARMAAFAASVAAPAGIGAFDSLEALLASRACDALILATPDGLHAEQVRACAAAGVHVLCEKPLALDGVSAQAAWDACRAAGVHLGVGYHLRHHAGHRLMRAELAERVGTVRHVDLRWTWPDPASQGWRAQGHGARWWSLAALGTHALDLAGWLVDRPLTVASASLWPEDGVDRAAEVLLRGDGGLLVHVFVSVELRTVSRISIVGTAGELEALGTLGARGAGTLTWRAPREEPRAVPFTTVDPYREQLRAFLTALRDGSEPSASGEDGLRNVRWLEQLGPAAHAGASKG
ncbi:Gfo/Idh/MocA family oxidoreductase [Pyxidicoccus parkwayensis]|uniref:Gfo/Idh/MocA family oxidoreductase n=1 Tax=Pyxidicoccus parkwayensis TaxID=2813578 RepID=A0ABX7P616_9BACT|nr:Gfo/Idh/MocA family oxidoreductase [Pyxidicoccus parkwaysis]QSQ25944.1 Gfo/Idh/MocA family oxidoreductase [Pyxidicoccus parkwaysis]